MQKQKNSFHNMPWEINEIEDIDIETSTGRLLIMALAALAVKVHPDLTSDQILLLLNLQGREVFKK